MPRVWITIIILVTAVLASSVAFHLRAQDQSAKGYVEALLQDILSSEGRNVIIDDVSVSLSGDVSARHIEIRDSEGAWLVIEGFNLDWQPLSLLSDILQIDKLSIDRVDLLRLPQSDESGVQAPRELTGLSAADIKSLQIGKFRTADTLAGVETILSVNGSGQVKQSPPQVRVDLEAARIDGTQGRLQAQIVLDPQSRQLEVDLVLNEPANGLVVNLLKIRGNPSVDLALAARGMIDDWAGNFRLDLDSTNAIRGTAQLASEPSGVRLTMDASGNMGRLVPPDLASIFGGSSQLVASVLIDPERSRADVERVRLDNDVLQLRLSGPLDWAGEESDLTVELRSIAAAPLIVLPQQAGTGAVGVASISADLHVTGPLDFPRWTLAGTVRSITSDTANLADIRLNLEGAGITPGDQPVMFSGETAGVLALGAKDLLPPAILGPFTGRFAAERQGNGRVSFTDLTARFGVVDLAASGSLMPKLRTFDLTASAASQSPTTGYQVLDRLLEGDIKLEGRIASNDRDSIGLKGWQVTGPALNARLDGQFDDTSLDISVKADIDDLAIVQDGIAGKAHLTATIKGPRRAPEAIITADGEGVTLMSRSLDQPRLDAVVVLDRAKPVGKLDFSARLEEKPVAVHATLETTADGVRLLRDVTATSGSARLSGELRAPATGTPTGHFSFSAPDLADIAPFLFTRLSGSMSGELDLQEEDGQGRLRVDVTGRDVASDAFSARMIAGNLVVANLLRQPQLQGRLGLEKVRVGDLAFATIEAVAKKKDVNGYIVSLMATGDDLSTSSEVEVEFRGSDTIAKVTRLEGRAGGIPFIAAQPFRIRQRERTVAVDGAVLGVGAGRIEVSGTVAPLVDMQLGLRSVPLAAFEQIAAMPGLSGTVSGRMELAGELSTLDGRFELSGSDVSLAALRDQGLQAVSFEAAGTIRGRKIALQGTGRSGSNLSASIEGEIDIGPPPRLDIRLRGRTDADAFADRLARDAIRMEGAATFDLRVRGAPDRPVLDGNVAISNAVFGDAEGRFIVRNGSGQLAIVSNVIHIAALQGAVGRNGRALVTGTVGLDEGPLINLRAKIEDGVYYDGTLVNARYDADLTLSGSLAGTPLLAGQIVLKDTKIALSEIVPGALQPLDVKHAHAPANVMKQVASFQSRRGGGAINVLLDVTIAAAEPITVNGRGLNVQLGGKLKLAGPLMTPVATGAFRLQRGSLKLLARRLEFESGNLQFDRDLDPRISLVAVSRAPDATITLTISGRASAPDIAVTSSPRMPQEEALARLVFDRSMLQISPLQIAQLASSISVLSGGSDTDVLAGFRNTLGVDWLEVTQTATGETAIGAGKRISDRLSVGVEQTTQTNTSRVIIDLNITRNLKARGAAGTDGSSRAGVFFEKDY